MKCVRLCVILSAYISLLQIGVVVVVMSDVSAILCDVHSDIYCDIDYHVYIDVLSDVKETFVEIQYVAEA